MQVFHLEAHHQGVPSRLPDLKIPGPFPDYLHQCTCAVHQAVYQSTRYTSALDLAQANQAAYLLPTYIYKSCPMVGILTILPGHFEER